MQAKIPNSGEWHDRHSAQLGAASQGSDPEIGRVHLRIDSICDAEKSQKADRFCL